MTFYLPIQVNCIFLYFQYFKLGITDQKRSVALDETSDNATDYAACGRISHPSSMIVFTI